MTDDPLVRALSRAVDTRLALETARRRIGMWFADPASDPAPNADRVLAEVAELLGHAPEAVSAANGRKEA